MVVEDCRLRCTIRLIGKVDQQGMATLLERLRTLINKDVDLPTAQYQVEILLLDTAEWTIYNANVSDFGRHFDVVFSVEECCPEVVRLTLGNARHRLDIKCPSMEDFNDRVLNAVAIKTTLQEYFTKPEYWGRIC